MSCPLMEKNIITLSLKNKKGDNKMIYYKEYTLIYTCSGISLYDSNGFIQNFPSENEAIEYIEDKAS